MLERLPVAQLFVHGGLKEANPASSLGFGPVKRCISFPKQRFGIKAIEGIERDPDA